MMFVVVVLNLAQAQQTHTHSRVILGRRYACAMIYFDAFGIILRLT